MTNLTKPDEIQFRVRYGETDQMGVVYHGNYAQYFEMGRTEWLRKMGFSYKQMEKEGIMLPVINLSINYKKSAFYDDLIKVKTKLVKGLKPNGKTTSNWDFDVLAGGGAIFSTVEDLSKFALAQFDNSNNELALTQKPTFKVNDNMSIGLGWHILKRKNGGELIWHSGGTGGYTSSMALDLENKNGIMILSNVSAFNKNMGNIDQLCLSLIHI